MTATTMAKRTKQRKNNDLQNFAQKLNMEQQGSQ
jgi:hypothetical protein